MNVPKHVGEADLPYALESMQERTRRLALLARPHMRALADFVRDAQAASGYSEIPHFDPCDGGVKARALFLSEAPGPKSIQSGFVSRNTPDQASANLCELLHDADLKRSDTALWSVVPWHLGDGKNTRSAERADIDAALPYLQQVIALLPRVIVIVLLGKKAQSIEPKLKRWTSAKVLTAAQPSTRDANAWPSLKKEIAVTMQEVMALLDEDEFLRQQKALKRRLKAGE